MNLILQDIYNSRIPSALGLTTTDPRLVQWVNEVQLRLLTKGLWWGTYGKYRMNAYGSMITLPPVLATLESVAVCTQPVPIHDMWFEFLANGVGTRSDNVGVVGACGIPEADYRGQFPVFRELTNTNPQNLTVVATLAADAGKTVTITGYDNYGNWIRTNPGGVWQDGETVTLAVSPGTTTTNYFTRIAGVRFSAQRAGTVSLYEYDTVTLISTLTGFYQWWETNPSYSRWLLPQIPNYNSSQGTPPAGWQQTWTQNGLPSPTTGLTATTVEIVGKKEFIPVALPNDPLIIGCLPALKFMAQATKKEEDAVSQADLAEALGFETKALGELDDELDHYLGSGRRIGITVSGAMMADGQCVENFM